MPSDDIPALLRLARPRGVAGRKALLVSSDYPETVVFIICFYDELGFDAVDNSLLNAAEVTRGAAEVYAPHGIQRVSPSVQSDR